MRFIIFLSLFLFHSQVFCGIKKHIKPAYNKHQVSSIKGVDYIYVINLDERPEKYQHTVDQLKKYSIVPYRFSAVNGWKLSKETIHDVGLKFSDGMDGGFMATTYDNYKNLKEAHETISVKGKAYFCHCMSPGAIGIVLSHLSVLEDAFRSGYRTVWIMEDDVDVLRDPHILSKHIENLDNNRKTRNWDILFTDRDTKNNRGEYVPCYGVTRRPNFSPPNLRKYRQRVQVSPTIMKIGARFGAYSYIIRRSGMKKILDFIHSKGIFLPYDMDFYLPPTLQAYALIKAAVSHSVNAPSDNGCPYYKQGDTETESWK
ncbi:MAG: glycosyltransferase family 25 protein [Simkaniaceae bacterium]|nr:glycosyltransferase family 25 protein [Simkaniaceae bacterium]